MAPASNKQLSIKLTRFFLRFVGFWMSNNAREQLLLDLALTYTIVAVIFGTGVIWMDFYYSMGDFYKFAYALTNVMTLMMVLFKVTIFSIKRRKIIELIRYSRDNFWEVEYDEFGTEVLEDCEKQCVLFVCTFTVFAQGTVCSYTITPIIDNMGKNDTDRSLIFPIWLDLPVTTTPYFELLFFVETLSLYHVGVLYFCFDNLLCILNVHVNGQFRILSRRLEKSCDVRKEDKFYRVDQPTSDEENIRESSCSLKNFKTCIRQHQALISFVDNMECVYSLVILGQVVVFSLLICLVAYQAFLESLIKITSF